MKHCGTKELETERLILRRFVIDDAAAMYKNWASDGEVTKFLTWPTHTGVEDSKAILEDWAASYRNENYYQWAIVLKENDSEPIGGIGAVNINDDLSIIHIGYCLGQQWWHCGVMSEALNAVIKFFFNQVEANRIEGRHDSRNPRSGMVMRRCGMKYEGTMRSSDRNNHGICDACWYGILRKEYLNK